MVPGKEALSEAMLAWTQIRNRTIDIGEAIGAYPIIKVVTIKGLFVILPRVSWLRWETYQ